MSKQTIWNRLRSYGISEVGTAALMGNFECESNNESCRVQGDNSADRARSKQYAADVNSGRISPNQWALDDKGWGLYQLTFHKRKDGYLEYCKEQGYPIESEQAQCEYAYIELSKDFPSLLKKLMSADGDMKSLSDEICRYFENPAVKNYDPRYSAAQRIYNEFHGTATETAEKPAEPTPQSICGEDTEGTEILAPVLFKGCKGRAVYMMQCGLTDLGYDCGIPDGDFGKNTESAVRKMQREYGQECDGVCDCDEWQILLQ